MKHLQPLILLIFSLNANAQSLLMKPNVLLKDSINEGVLFFDIMNISTDTVYFSDLYDSDISIISPKKVCSKKLTSRKNYPSKHTFPNDQDTTYCMEPIFQNNLIVIPPHQNYTLKIFLLNFLCEPLKGGIKYKGTITLIITPEVIKYCPKLWNGIIESNWEWSSNQ